METTVPPGLSQDQQFWLILANLSGLLIIKVLLILVAYFVIRMGYQLLVDGVKGNFKFNTELHGVKADLVSASPGTFFLLLGVSVLLYTLHEESTVSYKQSVDQISAEDKVHAPIPEKNPF